MISSFDNGTSANLEFKKELERRTKRFAVRVFRFLDSLPSGHSSRVIGYQLGKAASSVGANYREANRAESKDDFVHKIGIVLKECAESDYWLDILQELYPKSDELRAIRCDCIELLKLFHTIGRSSKKTRQLANSPTR